MRVAIVGSRDHPVHQDVIRTVQRLAEKHPTAVVISGGAPGVDTWAEIAAESFGLEVVSIRPKGPTRDGYGIEVIGATRRPELWNGDPIGTYATFRDAALARNTYVAMDCDHLIAFWNGESHGTKYTINEATRLGRSVHVRRTSEQ